MTKIAIFIEVLAVSFGKISGNPALCYLFLQELLYPRMFNHVACPCQHKTQEQFNTFGADWRIYASYIQMHRVRIDVYKRQCDNFSRTKLVCNEIFHKCSSVVWWHTITFFVLIWLQWKFAIMFSIPTHIILENFQKISSNMSKNLFNYTIWYPATVC